ncbi:MAG TPA: hypothetical protein VHN99_07425 [Deinococcales bacterium]|nr:hypothetical protein [Deinococcales bacterium]
MRYYTSLHWQARDDEDAQAIVQAAVAALDPGMEGLACRNPGWVALYTARLEEQDLQSIDAYARRLPQRNGVAFLVNDDESLAVIAYRDGQRAALHLSGDGADTAFTLHDQPGQTPQDLAGALNADPTAVQAAVVGGQASARVAALAGLCGIPQDLATVGFDDLIDLDEDGDLPEDFEFLEAPEEQGKPSLNTFFGKPEFDEGGKKE